MPQCSSRRTAEQPLSRSSAVRSRSGPFSARETARRAACVSPCGQNVRRCSAPVQAKDGRSDLRPGQTGPVQQPPVGPLGLHGECQQQVLRADAGVPQPAASAHASRSAAESSGGRSRFAKSLPPLNIGILARLRQVQTRRKKFAIPNFPIAFS